MKTKAEILQDVSRLKAASPSEGRKCFAELEEIIAEYFAPQDNMERIVGECAYQLAYNYEYRNTVYANQEVMGKFSEDYPRGYEDVRDVFDGGGVWEELAAMPEDKFAAAFKPVTGSVSESDTGGATAATTMTNPYLEDWTVRAYESWMAILSELGAIINFCEEDATNNGLAVYFEEHGGIISAPTRKEIAERVFVTGGYAEVICAYGLNIHIPTYIASQNGTSA